MELVYALTFALAGFLVVLIARVYVAKSDGHPVKFAEKARHSAQITSGGWKVLGWVLAILLVARVGYWMFSGPMNAPTNRIASQPYVQPARPASATVPALSRASTQQEILAAPHDGASLTLEMPAHCTSAHVEVPGGCTPSFTGDDGTFISHCLYADGRIGTIDAHKNTITAGPMLYAFAENTTNARNTVTYKPVCSK